VSITILAGPLASLVALSMDSPATTHDTASTRSTRSTTTGQALVRVHAYLERLSGISVCD